jgi:hypothetical protein
MFAYFTAGCKIALSKKEIDTNAYGKYALFSYKLIY